LMTRYDEDANASRMSNAREGRHLMTSISQFCVSLTNVFWVSDGHCADAQDHLWHSIAPLARKSWILTISFPVGFAFENCLSNAKTERKRTMNDILSQNNHHGRMETFRFSRRAIILSLTIPSPSVVFSEIQYRNTYEEKYSSQTINVSNHVKSARFSYQRLGPWQRQNEKRLLYEQCAHNTSRNAFSARSDTGRETTNHPYWYLFNSHK
jgi:hypothetical protein